jgi:hypothetical protein
MTESMIKRVAKAIWEERRQRAMRDGIDLEMWGDGTIPRANGIMEEASEAIRALRDSLTPKFATTVLADGFVDWVRSPQGSEEWFGNYADFEAGWRLAFDSILSDTEQRG